MPFPTTPPIGEQPGHHGSLCIRRRHFASNDENTPLSQGTNRPQATVEPEVDLKIERKTYAEIAKTAPGKANIRNESSTKPVVAAQKMIQPVIASKRSLIDLPTELILCIADYLGNESIPLLSLVSRRMHMIITKNMTWSLNDEASRIAFCLILQRDYANFLPCRQCGWLFKRRDSKNNPIYSCQREHREHSRYQREPVLSLKPCDSVCGGAFTRGRVDAVLKDSLLRLASAEQSAKIFNHECFYKQYDGVEDMHIKTSHSIHFEELVYRAEFSLSFKSEAEAIGSLHRLSEAACAHSAEGLFDIMHDVLGRTQSTVKISHSMYTSAVLRCLDCTAHFTFRFHLSKIYNYNGTMILWVWTYLGGLHPDRGRVGDLWMEEYYEKLLSSHDRRLQELQEEGRQIVETMRDLRQRRTDLFAAPP